MKSIAVWCSKVDPTLPVPENIELHFNLWKLPSSELGHSRFLDIGIKIANTKNVNHLKLYFPFKIEKKNICDVVGKFISKPDLVDAIFNDSYKTTATSTSKKFPLINSAGKLMFSAYQLDETDFEIEPNFSGTIMKIKCNVFDEPVYYRFRVEGKYLDTLSTIQKTPNAVLQSAFSKMEVIDFRVNEARDLDRSLLELISKEQQFKIKKAHFFFVCSSNDEITGSHTPFLSCRSLEAYRWLKYFNDKVISDDQVMLAYHWKWDDNKGERKDFNVLIKSRYERNNWATIGQYILGILIVGLAINLSSSFLFEKFK